MNNKSTTMPRIGALTLIGLLALGVTTGTSAATFSAGPGLGLTIGDGSGTDMPGFSALRTIEIPDVGAFGEIWITVGINHTWVGDLVIALETPANGSFTLMDRPGVPSSTFGNSATLDSTGGFPISFHRAMGPPAEQIGSGCSIFVGDAGCPDLAYTSEDILPLGLTSNGDWELTVTDFAGGDTGVLDFLEIRGDINAIPLPAALPLFLVGLGLFGVMLRRRA